MPPWPRGRLIEVACGYLAALFILYSVVKLLGALIAPSLFANSYPLTYLIMIAWGLAIGLVWFCLRNGKLKHAEWAAGANALLLFGIMIAQFSRAIISDEPTGLLEGTAIYGFGGFLGVGFLLAYREIQRERERQEAKASV